MKKLFTLIVLIASCAGISRADSFTFQMGNAVREGLLTEIHVSKDILPLVSPEVSKKIPLLGKVDGVTAVTIFTAPNEDAVNRCYQILNSAFIFSETSMLLVNAEGKEYTAIYGTKESKEQSYFNRIIMFTNEGTQGQVLVVYGTITPQVLGMIKDSATK
ncbi:MAG: hypothetical protein K2H39_00420 [Paramuribaculum sp.]|nr:hypothetical protein [Paramuribaculum sp.]